ncbi:hypothetical protein BH09VER1_BH09VER1_54720 [soil metagenome]
MVGTTDTQQLRHRLAENLHEELGQHLAGTLLTAGALLAHLQRRRAPEMVEAARLVELLQIANEDVNSLILRLDSGKLR